MTDSTENTGGETTQPESKPKTHSQLLVENLNECLQENTKIVKYLSLEMENFNQNYPYLRGSIITNTQTQKELSQNYAASIERYDALILEIKKLTTSLREEVCIRNEFVQSIPTHVETNLSPDNLTLIEKLNKKAYFIKFFMWFGLGFFVFGFANFFYVNNVAAKWYAESIKSRRQMLAEYESRGYTVISRSLVDSLKQESEMVRQYIRQNPEKAGDLVVFAKGFHSKK